MMLLFELITMLMFQLIVHNGWFLFSFCRKLKKEEENFLIKEEVFHERC